MTALAEEDLCWLANVLPEFAAYGCEYYRTTDPDEIYDALTLTLKYLDLTTGQFPSNVDVARDMLGELFKDRKRFDRFCGRMANADFDLDKFADFIERWSNAAIV